MDTIELKLRSGETANVTAEEIQSIKLVVGEGHQITTTAGITHLLRELPETVKKMVTGYEVII